MALTKIWKTNLVETRVARDSQKTQKRGESMTLFTLDYAANILNVISTTFCSYYHPNCALTVFVTFDFVWTVTWIVIQNACVQKYWKIRVLSFIKLLDTSDSCRLENGNFDTYIVAVLEYYIQIPIY